MNFKKLSFFLMVFTISLFTLFAAKSFAVPAAGIETVVTQPSGQSLTVKLVGDENFNFHKDTHDNVVIKDKDHYWKYAELKSNKLVPTNIRYGIDPTVRRSLLKADDLLKKSSEIVASFENPNTTESYQTNRSTTTTSINPQQKLLVVMVEFTDQKFITTEADWYNYYFGTTNSVNAYYKDVTMNKISFVPAAETYGTTNNGVVKVSLNSAHPNWDRDKRQALARSAVQATDPFVNFSLFDTDNNGIISKEELHIYIVVAGYEYSYKGDENDGKSVWAHNWNFATSLTLDGKQLSPYNMQGELHGVVGGSHMATIGISCHELGHALGLPDLYDVTGQTDGVGIHSIMSHGTWGHNKNEFVWMDDSVPAGTTLNSYRENWSWVISPVMSGSQAHKSTSIGGPHMHEFYNATQTMQVSQGDILYCWIYLEQNTMPTEIMLQWRVNNSWNHRAYWSAGNSIIGGGLEGAVEGTSSLRKIGPIPNPGKWVRLEVPASLVGLDGKTVNGMSFFLYNGGAVWDKTGKFHYTNNLGALPVHFDAWSKVKLGVVEPITVGSSSNIKAGSFTLNAHGTGTYNVLKIPLNSQEYFLLENRQFTGFDQALAGSKDFGSYVSSPGIALWHVDESGEASQSNPSKRVVNLEEANQHRVGFSEIDTKNYPDKRPYWGLGNTMLFNETTTPNSKSNSGFSYGISVSIDSSIASSAMDVVVDSRNWARSTGLDLRNSSFLQAGSHMVSPGVIQNEVFSRDANGNLYSGTRSIGNSYLTWTQHNFNASNTPNIAFVNDGIKSYAFARGTDNALWVSSKTANNPWTSWINLGGNLSATPNIAATLNQLGLVAFIKGTDNKLQYKYLPYGSSTWSTWYSINSNLSNANDIALAKMGFGLNAPIHVFFRMPDSSLGRIIQTSASGNTWGSVQSLGGNLSNANNIVATTRYSNKIEVYVRGTDNYLHIADLWSHLNRWIVHSFVNLSNTPNLALAKDLSGTDYLFFRGTDNALYFRSSNQSTPRMHSKSGDLVNTNWITAATYSENGFSVYVREKDLSGYGYNWMLFK